MKIEMGLHAFNIPGKTVRRQCPWRNVLGSLLFLGMVASGVQSRADVQSWNGNTSTDWSTASNWTAAFVPNTNSAIRIGIHALGVYPTVSQDAWAASMSVGLVNTNPALWPTLRVTGGTLKVTNVLIGGVASNGIIELSGGTLDFTNKTTLGGTGTDGTVYPGRLKVTGGTARLGVLTINPGSNIDISQNGIVQVAKAHTQIERIYDPLTDGRITSWGGRGTPVVEYTADTAVITAGPAPNLGAAYAPYPENGAMDVGLQVALDWTPGDDATGQTVKWGTSPGNMQPITNLNPTVNADTDYYWQVITTLSNGSTVEGPVWKFTPATPRVFWASQPVGPGKVALVNGTGFKNVRVQVAQLPAGNGSPNPAAPVDPRSAQPILTDAATLGGLNWVDAEILAQSSSTIHFRIPAAYTDGVYAYKVTRRDENNQPTLVSAVYLLNAPQQLWVLGDRGKSATPGGTIRITGIGIALPDGSTPAIALVNPANQVVRTIPASTKGIYSSQFAIPADLPPADDYRIFINNGHGQAGGWQLCTTRDFDLSQAQYFSIQPAPAAGTYSYTMNPASPTHDADFTAALSGAENNNGGTIHFPAGNYQFTKGFTIPVNTTISGDGPGVSVLNFSNGVQVGSSWFEIILRSRTRIQNLSLNATASTGSYVVSTVPSDNTVTQVTVDNVHTIQVPQPAGGMNYGAFSMRGTGIVVKNCQTTGSGIALRDVSHALVAGNTVRANQGGISNQTVNNVIVEDNHFIMSLDGTTENAGNNLTAYGAPVSQNFYFARNTSGSAEGITSVSDWTCDGGDGIYFGYAESSASTATTGSITLSGPLMTHRNWPSQFGVFVVGGRGAGQWRRVLSHQTVDGKSTLVLDQPWDIGPDASSIVTAVNVIGRITLHNNLFKDRSTYIDGYSVAVDYLMDGNTISLESPSIQGECQSGGGGHHLGLMTGWHYQVLNTQMQQGDCYFSVTCSEQPDVSSLGLDYSWYYNEPLLHGFVFRGNRASGGAATAGTELSLGVVSGYSAYYRLTGGIVEDCVMPPGLIGNVENLVYSGRGNFVPAPVPFTANLLFQLDASDNLSITRDFDDRVSRWNNIAPSGAGGYAEQTVAAARPAWSGNRLNGLPIVDFGAFGGGRWMQFKKNDGTNLDLKTIRTVFWVMKGGNFLLGDDNTYHFHRPIGTIANPTSPLWASYASTYVRNGNTYLNGSLIDGMTTPLSGQYSLISLVTTGNVEAGRLCIDRSNTARTGGQQIAEILIYNRALSDAERQQVEAYLNTKWQIMP